MRFRKEDEEVEEEVEVMFPPPPMSAHDEDVEETDGEEEEDEDEDREEEVDSEEDDEEDEDEDREEEVDSEEDDEDEDEEDEDEEDDEDDEEEVPSTDVPTTAPLYLVYHHGRRKSKQSFFSISERVHFVKSVPEMNGMTCCACCEGWLVMLDNYGSRRCFLFNPMSMEKIELPPIKPASNYFWCVLSSSPPDCVVMFVYQESACVFCRPNDRRWNRKFLIPKYKEESAKNNYFRFVGAAGSCEGKIYISYENGSGIKVLTPITTTNNATRINNHSFNVEKYKIKIKEVQSDFKLQSELKMQSDFFDFFSCSAHYSIYLVESCGELFMVVKIYRQSDEDIRDMEIYTFNVFKLKYSSFSSSTETAASASWEKVQSLGDDRVFFLAQTCSVSVSALKLQVKENCIYYSEPDNEHLYAFDMGKQKFYSILPCPHLIGRHTDEPSWMLLPTV